MRAKNKWKAEVRNKETNELLRVHYGDSVLTQLKERVIREEKADETVIIEYKFSEK